MSSASDSAGESRVRKYSKAKRGSGAQQSDEMDRAMASPGRQAQKEVSLRQAKQQLKQMTIKQLTRFL